MDNVLGADLDADSAAAALFSVKYRETLSSLGYRPEGAGAYAGA